MNIVKANGSNEIIIKKSRFISYVYKLYQEEDIEKYISLIKQQHPDARHIAYAYVYENQYGYSDAGEPNKTAGYPMLEVINLKQITNTLIICVRYFGGIKLGSGGLIRAYAQSASQVIDTVGLSQVIVGINCQIKAHIRYLTKIEMIISHYQGNIVAKEINHNVIIDCLIPQQNYNVISQELNQLDYLIQIEAKNNVKMEVVGKEEI